VADPGGRAVYGVGLRPLACWDFGLASCRGRGRFSLQHISLLISCCVLISIIIIYHVYAGYLKLQ
jgi:hypothetical protein